MKAASLLALICSLAGAPLLQAAPLQPADVAPEARWVLHANLEAVRSSRLMALLQTTSFTNDLAAFRTRIREQLLIDLDQLSSITLYGRQFKKESDGVLVLRGNLDWQTHLQRVAETSPRPNLILQRVESGPQPVYHLNKKLFLQPQGADRLVISQARQGLIQRGNTSQETTPGEGREQGPLDYNGLPQDVFLLAMADMGEAGRALPARANLLKAAEAGRVAVGEEKANLFIDVLLRAGENASAVQMQQALQGLAALLQLGEGKEPFLVELAQSAQVEQTNQVVTLKLSLSLVRVLEAARIAAARRATQSVPVLPPPAKEAARPQP